MKGSFIARHAWLTVIAVVVLAAVVATAQQAGGTFIDKRDGKKYRTVKIGNQT
jgi:hypothetical protein